MDYADYQAPASPTYPGNERGQPGELLFAASQHFMSWVISQDRKPTEHRGILRNLEHILRICEVSFQNGRIINSMEEKNALGVLRHLTTGLENGDETWADIFPATELMIYHLEARNPKAEAVGQMVLLKFAYHDKSNASEELSILVRKVIDTVTSHITPTIDLELIKKTNHLVRDYLQGEKWNAKELEALEKELKAFFEAA